MSGEMTEEEYVSDWGEGHPILEVKDLAFGYDPLRTVIQDISFTLDKPGFTCIVGPNGVGKSTLIKCINGIIKPTKGEVKVFGRDVSTFKLKELAKIVGYVPVMSGSYNVMTVLDAVMIGRYSRQKWRTNPEDIMVAHKALQAMEIDDLSMRNFNELSAGQHQKVSLSRGLVQEPKLLLLDEPTSNLDIRHQVYVSAFLKRLCDKTGTSVLMISHDLNLAAKFADQIIVMGPPGTIHSIGTPQEVFTEQMIRDVYNVRCRVIDDEGKPHIILEYVV
jgi:iron complex transport system ATP-binding protein